MSFHRSNKLEIRGCCFGIPIGCGSLVLIVLGTVLSQVQRLNISGFLALKFLMAIMSVPFLVAGILLVLGRYEEKRQQGKPAS